MTDVTGHALSQNLRTAVTDGASREGGALKSI
jgi:hypothetical protein